MGRHIAMAILSVMDRQECLSTGAGDAEMAVAEEVESSELKVEKAACS